MMSEAYKISRKKKQGKVEDGLEKNVYVKSDVPISASTNNRLQQAAKNGHPVRAGECRQDQLKALSSQAANKRLSSVDVNCQRREAVEQPFSVDDATCGVDIDDEEEEGIQDVVIDKVFTSYSNSYDGDVSKAQENILHAYLSGSSACLICIEVIRKDDAIWACKECCCLLHLHCIQQWSKESVFLRRSQLVEAQLPAPGDLPWFCPKCRHEYALSRCPTKSLCFCRKVEDPAFDPWLIPHSCGQICGQDLKPMCGHTCLLICHPGPCPPCPKMVSVPCFCGNSGSKLRRCNARAWRCGNVCGKLLACSQHWCQNPCHPGNCPPCNESSIRRCACGKSNEQQLCAASQWHCGQVCGRHLACGNHTCELVCHNGVCLPCPQSGQRSCPCGKISQKLSCLEDVSMCGDTCGKLLSCGLHRCSQRCHFGLCGQCVESNLKQCRCGLTRKDMRCSSEFLCSKRCQRLRSCGNHQCKRKCCDGCSCPPCGQMCNKTLQCGNHKCPSLCHLGACYPCGQTKTVACFCERTRIVVPCGSERKTKPPRCRHLCSLPSTCHHPEQRGHRCHFKRCPTCSQVCGLLLPSCEHSCPEKCHDNVKIQVQSKNDAIWTTSVLQEEVVRKECPSCRVVVPVWCMGLHLESHMVCSEVRPFSCGRSCDKLLECGNHRCQLACHVVVDAVSATEAGRDCERCELPCQKPRHADCRHRCPRPCHPGNCAACPLTVRMRCHCNAMSKHITCSRWQQACPDGRDSLRCCGGLCPKEIECGHVCGGVCHTGPCVSADDCDRKIFLRCPCGRRKQAARCRDRRQGREVGCDESCLLHRQEQTKREESKREKDAEVVVQRQTEELQTFERFGKRRGRKVRKRGDMAPLSDDDVFWRRHKMVVILSSSFVLLASVSLMYHLFR